MLYYDNANMKNGIRYLQKRTEISVLFTFAKRLFGIVKIVAIRNVDVGQMFCLYHAERTQDNPKQVLNISFNAL